MPDMTVLEATLRQQHPSLTTMEDGAVRSMTKDEYNATIARWAEHDHAQQEAADTAARHDQLRAAVIGAAIELETDGRALLTSTLVTDEEIRATLGRLCWVLAGMIRLQFGLEGE